MHRPVPVLEFYFPLFSVFCSFFLYDDEDEMGAPLSTDPPGTRVFRFTHRTIPSPVFASHEPHIPPRRPSCSVLADLRPYRRKLILSSGLRWPALPEPSLV